jgi:mono/diheme cytochrome c family protein
MTGKNFRFLKLASVVVMGGALIWFSARSASAQPVMGPGGRVITGKGQYIHHCAQCHGLDGKGDGPVAPALKVSPGDLTMLAKNNGGVFPEERVINSIKGTSSIASHGTTTGATPMPVWGLAFRASTGSGTGADFTPEQVDRKIKLLADYIKSIQQK